MASTRRRDDAEVNGGTPIRIRLGANNIYVIPGTDGLVCIDAGPDYDSAWDDLTAQLRARGGTPADVRAVILTHSHLDHAGLAARWQEAGARVYAGRGEAEALVMDEHGRQHLRALARATLIAHGVPEALAHRPVSRRAMSRLASAEGEWPGPLRTTSIVPDALLDDGDEVRDAGTSILARSFPGHTPGTLVVIDENSGRMFTGDHLLPRMVATAGIQFVGGRRWPSMPPFVRSLERWGRAPARPPGIPPWYAWPGHGDIIEDVPAAAAWSLRSIERRTERLRRRLAEGPSTAYGLATRLLPHLPVEHVWPVMAETIGVLDLLEERGEVAAERHKGKVVYRLT